MVPSIQSNSAKDFTGAPGTSRFTTVSTLTTAGYSPTHILSQFLIQIEAQMAHKRNPEILHRVSTYYTYQTYQARYITYSSKENILRV